MTTELTAPPAVPSGSRRRGRASRRRSWTWMEILSATWLVLLVFGMFLLPLILHLDALEFDAKARFAGPSAEYLLGTDNYGRDLLARALSGAKVSLFIGLGSTFLALVIGVPIGTAAAYFGGWVDAVISFVTDVILGFPGLVLALVLTAFLGASKTNVMIAITAQAIPAFVRMARSQTLALMNRDFVEASKVLGTRPHSIIARDLFPNIADTILAFAFVAAGRAIIIEGGLSFLGMGLPLPQPTWGVMINEGRQYLNTDPHLILVPSVFLMLSILSFNVLADRLRADATTDGGGKGA
ncbi:ABC transporter permease [Nocardioides sp. LHD-245]|uniref:ABC transporter permease n=1 Tax=Nocardioides sp. LHD-245 TaxID=3051387 RepID=UPI0027DF1EE1|nr:ABC transporter permease [Nocardioides sp. LHD-245]